MTEVYFIRHAQPDYSVREDAARPLTQEGRRTCARVTDYLMDKSIGLVVSSPFRRAVDTVAPFAQAQGLEIKLDGRFQERKISGAWIEDYETFSRRQWEDFSYREADGESLGETQARWLEALGELLRAHPGERIAVGCHGAGLAALLRHYDSQFGLGQFFDLVDKFPWCAHLSFDGETCVGVAYVDLSLEVSPCGMVCAKCEHNPQDCPGCAAIEGKAYWLQYTGGDCCDIYQCCKGEKGLPHCGKCAQLPCARYDLQDPTHTPEENQSVFEAQMALLNAL